MVAREQFSSQASPDLLAAMRKVARDEGRHFQAVLEDAIQEYLDNKAQGKVRPEVMAHFRRECRETPAPHTSCWPDS